VVYVDRQLIILNRDLDILKEHTGGFETLGVYSEIDGSTAPSGLQGLESFPFGKATVQLPIADAILDA
jgi:hypothetical protein